MTRVAVLLPRMFALLAVAVAGGFAAATVEEDDRLAAPEAPVSTTSAASVQTAPRPAPRRAATTPAAGTRRPVTHVTTASSKPQAARTAPPVAAAEPAPRRERPGRVVPNVVGETYTQALSVLGSAGFQVVPNVVATQRPQRHLRVLSQSPPAGGAARAGTHVLLTVERYVPPTPAPTPTG